LGYDDELSVGAATIKKLGMEDSYDWSEDYVVLHSMKAITEDVIRAKGVETSYRQYRVKSRKEIHMRKDLAALQG